MSLKKKVNLLLKFFFNKRILRTFISVIFLLNSVSLHANSNENSSNQLIQDMSKAVVNLQETAEQGLESYQKSAEELSQNPKILDNQQVFHMDNQSVILYDSSHIEHNDKELIFREMTTTLDRPFFKSIRVENDPENKRVLIHAVSGADQHNHGGKIVATHIIPDIEASHVINNDLLTVIIEKSGSVSALSSSMIYTTAFTSPIPVFRKILQIQEFSKLNITAISFAHRAETPNTKVQNREVYTGGDIIIELGDKAPLQVISQVQILDKMVAGLKYLEMAMHLTSFDKTQFQNLELLMQELFNEASSESEKKEIKLWFEGLNPQEIEFLRRLSTDTIQQLKLARTGLNEFMNNPVDHFTGDEWKITNSEMNQRAEVAKENFIKKQNRFKKIKQLLEKVHLSSSVLDPRDYILTPDTAENFMQTKNPVEFYKKTRLEQMHQLLTKFASSKITFFAMIAAPVVTYSAFPFVYEQSQVMQDLKTLSYFYENFVPDVIKNISYRSLLLTSMGYQLILIPAVYISAFSIKYSVLSMAQAYKNINTKFAIWVKNLARDYRSLTVTQVLLTANNRFFSKIVIPYWKVIMEGLMGQRVFFDALKNGVNPFKFIRMDSEIGKQMSLDEGKFVGLNLPNPLGFDKIGDKLPNSFGVHNRLSETDQSMRLSLQNLLAQENKDKQLMVWSLATLTISEKYNLDPATLLILSQKNTSITPEMVKNIVNDPAFLSEWQLLSNKLSKFVAHMDIKQVRDLLANDPTAKDQYTMMQEHAKNIAIQIEKSSYTKFLLEVFTLKFKQTLKKYFKMSLNIGDRSSKVLSKVIAGKYTAKQVNQDFIVDQPMTTVLPGVFGEMADLSNSKYLMAQANEFMYTSKAQLFSITSNLYGHLVGSGASLSLLFDALNTVKEEKYKPLEYKEIISNEWSENVFKSAYKWIKYTVFSPRESDVGRLALQKYSNRIDTIFASLTFTYLARVLVSGQPFDYAMQAFLIFFLVSHSIYGFVWDFIVSGNKHLGDEAEKNKKWLLEAQHKLSEAIRFGNSKETSIVKQEILENYFKNNPKALKNLLNIINRNQVLNGIKIKIEDLKKSDTKAYELVGLLLKLQIANHTNNTSETETIKTHILNLYKNQITVENLRQVSSLSTDGLLKFTQIYPPLATKENYALSWLTSIGLGAVLTTILATELAPKLMDTDYLDKPGVVWDALMTCLTFTFTYYMAFGKKPHELYQTIIKNVNERLFRVYSGQAAFEKGEIRDYFSSFLPHRKIDLQNREEKKSNSIHVFRCEKLFN